MRLTYSDGSVMNYPPGEVLRQEIGLLGPKMEFLVLTAANGSWLQAAWCPDEFALETRGPHVGGHMVTTVTDREQIVDAFVRFLDGDLSWVDAHVWSPHEAETPD
jgi:hypothetical protein